MTPRRRGVIDPESVFPSAATSDGAIPYHTRVMVTGEHWAGGDTISPPTRLATRDAVVGAISDADRRHHLRIRPDGLFVGAGRRRNGSDTADKRGQYIEAPLPMVGNRDAWGNTDREDSLDSQKLQSNWASTLLGNLEVSYHATQALASNPGSVADAERATLVQEGGVEGFDYLVYLYGTKSPSDAAIAARPWLRVQGTARFPANVNQVSMQRIAVAADVDAVAPVTVPKAEGGAYPFVVPLTQYRQTVAIAVYAPQYLPTVYRVDVPARRS